MQDVAVIDDPDVAESALEPVRARLLAELAEPGSASSLAPTLGLTRQKVNYHLRALESRGLIELVEERRKGNMTERVMQATAAAYVISPLALSAVAPDPGRAPDQLSAYWLVALGHGPSARSASSWPDRPVPVNHWPRSPSTPRSSSPPPPTGPLFAAELSGAVESLVAKYHHGSAEGGRKHRVVVGLHPMITRPESDSGPVRARSTP